MAKRSNAIPTFNPSSKEFPPENGFQPASIISSSQMNGLNYISYNFTNSFINALINNSGLTDGKVYAYTDTDWATKIAEDLGGFLDNHYFENVYIYRDGYLEIAAQEDDKLRISIDKLTMEDQNHNLTLDYNNGLTINNTSGEEISLTYNGSKIGNRQGYSILKSDYLNITNSDTNHYLNLYIDHLAYIGSSTWTTDFDDLTLTFGNTVINFIPSEFKTTTTHNVKSVYAQEFKLSDYNDNYTNLQNAVTAFLTNHYGTLTMLNVILYSSGGSSGREEFTLATRKINGTLTYFYMDTSGTWTKLSSFNALVPNKVTVCFC